MRRGTRVGEAELAGVIERLYAATLDRNRWRPALEGVAKLFGGRMANLELHDSRLLKLLFFDSIGGEPHEAEAYVCYYVETCPRVEHLFDTEVGSVHYDYSWFTERDMKGSEFYEDFLLQNDLRYYVGATLIDDGHRHGLIAVQRSPRLGHVDDDEIATMQALVPHLVRALEITTRLHEQQADLRNLRQGLSRLSVGVALVDARRRVVYLNDAARSVLGPEAPLTLVDGLLSARRREDRRRLTAFVEAAIAGRPAPSTLVVGERPHDAISVSVCRLPGPGMMDTLLSRPPPEAWLAMLVFEPIQSAQAALGPLQDLGLGLAEARLAVALADGESLAQYAARRGVSINTVRTHLARIRGKLDCRTQADVVRRVLQLLPRTRPDGASNLP